MIYTLNHKIKKTNIFLKLIIYAQNVKSKCHEDIFTKSKDEGYTYLLELDNLQSLVLPNHRRKITDIFMKMMIYTLYHTMKTPNVFLDFMIYKPYQRKTTIIIFLNLMIFTSNQMLKTRNNNLNVPSHSMTITNYFQSLMLFLYTH